MSRYVNVITKDELLDGFSNEETKEKIKAHISDWDTDKVLIVDENIGDPNTDVRVYNPFELNQSFGLCYTDTDMTH